MRKLRTLISEFIKENAAKDSQGNIAVDRSGGISLRSTELTFSLCTKRGISEEVYAIDVSVIAKDYESMKSVVCVKHSNLCEVNKSMNAIALELNQTP